MYYYILVMVERGRPPGIFIYSNDIFTKYVTGDAKTADMIRKDIALGEDIDMNWNTVVRRLDMLVRDHIIFGKRMGRFHIYQSVDFR